jgi:hypothetical protein
MLNKAHENTTNEEAVNTIEETISERTTKRIAAW